MESIVRVGGSSVDKSADLRGLSTDTKPTAADGFDVPHGSTWLCLDTTDVWFYNKNISKAELALLGLI